MCCLFFLFLFSFFLFSFLCFISTHVFIIFKLLFVDTIYFLYFFFVFLYNGLAVMFSSTRWRSSWCAGWLSAHRHPAGRLHPLLAGGRRLCVAPYASERGDPFLCPRIWHPAYARIQYPPVARRHVTSSRPQGRGYAARLSIRETLWALLTAVIDTAE